MENFHTHSNRVKASFSQVFIAISPEFSTRFMHFFAASVWEFSCVLAVWKWKSSENPQPLRTEEHT